MLLFFLFFFFLPKTVSAGVGYQIFMFATHVKATLNIRVLFRRLLAFLIFSTSSRFHEVGYMMFSFLDDATVQ